VPCNCTLCGLSGAIACHHQLAIAGPKQARIEANGDGAALPGIVTASQLCNIIHL
jgi:hypothetical protein